MNDILKQRLVGALILVALGVVFWPIIFVQPGDEEAAQPFQIPPRPQVATTPIEPPEQIGLRASPEQTAMSEVSDEAVTQAEEHNVVSAPLEPEPDVTETTPPPEPEEAVRSEPPAPLAMDSDGAPVAWILQVASVSSAEKADELRSRLISMNYKAYVKKVASGDKVLHRVCLGPKFERARLEQIKPAVDAEFGVNSMVARYVP